MEPTFEIKLNSNTRITDNKILTVIYHFILKIKLSVYGISFRV